MVCFLPVFDSWSHQELLLGHPYGRLRVDHLPFGLPYSPPSPEQSRDVEPLNALLKRRASLRVKRSNDVPL